MSNIENYIKAVAKALEKIGKRDLLTDEIIKIIIPIFENPKQFSEIDFENVNQFLKQAENDLKSAKILFKYKLYSNSTNLLQQATEKTAKAWCLYYGFISTKDLTSISHITPRAFFKALRSKMGDSAFRLIQAMNSRYNLDISALEELVNKRSNDLAHIKYDQIISIIRGSESSRS